MLVFEYGYFACLYAYGPYMCLEHVGVTEGVRFPGLSYRWLWAVQNTDLKVFSIFQTLSGRSIPFPLVEALPVSYIYRNVFCHSGQEVPKTPNDFPYSCMFCRSINLLSTFSHLFLILICISVSLQLENTHSGIGLGVSACPILESVPGVFGINACLSTGRDV